jgi:nicotinamidase-related amidase
MLNQENCTLIVIDIQENLYKAMDEKEPLLENLKKIIKGARVFGLPTLVTEQIPSKIGPTIPEIAELIAGITPTPKAHFSCCGDERFMEELKKIPRGQILMTGIESHVCVLQTTLDLIDMGYEVHLITDCVSSRTALNRQVAIERLVESGAIRSSSEIALFELMKVAAGDTFSRMIKIVK